MVVYLFTLNKSKCIYPLLVIHTHTHTHTYTDTHIYAHATVYLIKVVLHVFIQCGLLMAYSHANHTLDQLIEHITI